MRNILTPQEIEAEITRKAHEILATPPKKWDADAAQKTATMYDVGIIGGWGDEPEESADGGGEDSSPIDELEEEIQKMVLNRVKGKIREQLNQKDLKEELSPNPSPENSSVSLNDNVIKEGAEKRKKVGYNAALALLLESSKSDTDLINKVATFNNFVGLSISKCIYRTALQVGATDGYGSLENYLQSCADVIGRKPTVSESKTLMRLGKLLSLRDTLNSDSTPPKKES